MTDLTSFSAWLTSATRLAILVVRARVYQARTQNPALRSETNAMLKQITRELAARGEYDRRYRAWSLAPRGESLDGSPRFAKMDSERLPNSFRADDNPRGYRGLAGVPSLRR